MFQTIPKPNPLPLPFLISLLMPLMASPLRFLRSVNSSTSDSPDSLTFGSSFDFLVILAAFICALFCVLGLTAVARCVWLGCTRPAASESTTPRRLPKGLKKSALQSLPKFSFNTAVNGKLPDCAICLMEFVKGDEIRVLPQCGHGFHVGCIDMWLGSYSSCPSCRQIVVVEMCQGSGCFPTALGSCNSVDLDG